MFTKKKILWLLLALVILVASGCSPAATEQAAAEESAPAEEQAPQTAETESVEEQPAVEATIEEAAGPSQGGTVTFATSQEPDKISTNWTALAVSYMASNLVNDTLFVYDENVALNPRLAVEVPTIENGGISEDGKIYTLRLRQDVKWQDGEPFTSADVVFTLNVMANPETGVLKTYTFASLEAPDEYTVVVTFENTNATFAYDLTGITILPEHTLKDVTDWANAEYWQNPYPGTGAFIFSQWERGSYIMFEKNPDYYLGAPNLDQIIMQFIANPDAALTAAENGEVDMVFTVLGQYVPLYRNLGNLTVVETPSYSAFFVILNLRNPLMMDLRTRQALNHAVDREGILNTVVGGLGSLKYSPMPKPSWAWIDVATRYAYDPELAASLLEEVGWKDEDGDGIREAHGVEGVEDGTLFAWTINNIAGEAERLQICQILQQQWAEVGAQVDINTTDVANYVATNNGGEFAMSYGFLTFAPDPSSTAFWYKTQNALNWHGIGDLYPDVEEILLAAEQTVVLQERQDLYAQFQETIAEAATDVYIYDRNFYHAVNNRVHEFRPTPSGSYVWNAYEWWVDPQ